MESNPETAATTTPEPAHVAKLYGEPLPDLPKDLYIPPDALEVYLESFEGPLDLLLYLIRKANLSILDIQMAPLTAQYLEYVEAMRARNLELAAEYLLMAAMLLEIKSRMLLPRPQKGSGRCSSVELIKPPTIAPGRAAIPPDRRAFAEPSEN